MSAFSADWLALREPYDAHARNLAVRDAVAAMFTGWPALTIVDLASGTGATLRALTRYLPDSQSWKLVDNDLGLLARAAGAACPRAKVTTVATDLARDLEAALDGPVDLVTTSAFLDLVSSVWLDRLVTEVAARNIPFYAALTYDGRVTLEPFDPFDFDIIASVNFYQRGDKGFGPALGLDAAKLAVARLETVGYAVVHGVADWVLGPNDRDIQTELLSGWAAAAREVGQLSLTQVVAWLTRRRDAVASGRASTRVGHVDAFARPIGIR